MRKARVGIVGEILVVRDIETQKELGAKKMTSPNLIKDWLRKLEEQKNCEINNVDWDNTTGKGWIAL